MKLLLTFHSCAIWLWYGCAYQVSPSVAVQLDKLGKLMFNSWALAHALLLSHLAEINAAMLLLLDLYVFAILPASILVAFVVK